MLNRNGITYFTNTIFFFYLFFAMIFFKVEGFTIIPQVLGGLTLGFFIFEIIIKEAKILLPYPVLGFIVFILLCSISVSLSPASVPRFFTLIQIALFIFLISNVISKSGNIGVVTWGLTFGLGYIILNQVMEGRSLIDLAIESRVETEIGDQNDYAFMLSVCINLIFFDLIRSRHRVITWFILLLIVAIFSVENIIGSGSKAGILYLIITFSYFLYFSVRGAKRTTKILLFSLTASGIGGLYALLLASPHFERLLNMFTFFQNTKTKQYGRSVDTSSQERLDLINQAIALWQEKPLLGWGFDQYRYIKRGRETFSHNNYLEILCNHGLIGFILYYSIFLYIIWLFYKVKKISNNASEVTWIFSLILFLLVRDFVYVSYYDKLHFLVFAVILGILFHMKNKYLNLRKNITI